MSGKLHLICMKTFGFHAKIRCNLNLHAILDAIFPTFHTSVKRRKITFNS